MRGYGGILRIGAFTAVGFALGVSVESGRPRCGGVIGAAAGMIAGSVFNSLYESARTEDDGTVTYYSKSLPSYEDSEDIGYM